MKWEGSLLERYSGEDRERDVGSLRLVMALGLSERAKLDMRLKNEEVDGDGD